MAADGDIIIKSSNVNPIWLAGHYRWKIWTGVPQSFDFWSCFVLICAYVSVEGLKPSGQIPLRALRLTLRLSGSIQDNSKQLAELELTLPESSEQIWFFSIGIWTLAEYMIPWVSSAKEFAAKRQKVLRALGDWDVIEVAGEPACSDPWGSKLQRWVDNNLRASGGRYRPKSKKIPLTQRRESVSTIVADYSRPPRTPSLAPRTGRSAHGST